MRVVDGTPVPYSLTVYPDNGEPEPSAEEVRRTATEWLRRYKPDAHIELVEGRYVYYRYA